MHCIFYVPALYFLYSCIVFFIGYHLVLLHFMDIIVLNNPFDIICGHYLDINIIILSYLVFPKEALIH